MEVFNPLSTYRIQFNKDFDFAKTERIISYLKKMGITTIYASPVFEAQQGSMHGYDIINPLKINPDIGSEESFKKLSGYLKENGMGWLQDIVPNHMAFSPDNPWIYDVLAKGRD